MAFFTKVDMKIPVIPVEGNKLVLPPTVTLPPGGEMV